MFPAFPAHVQPTILCIWQEAHYDQTTQYEAAGGINYSNSLLQIEYTSNFFSLPFNNVTQRGKAQALKVYS